MAGIGGSVAFLITKNTMTHPPPYHTESISNPRIKTTEAKYIVYHDGEVNYRGAKISSNPSPGLMFSNLSPARFEPDVLIAQFSQWQSPQVLNPLPPTVMRYWHRGHYLLSHHRYAKVSQIACLDNWVCRGPESCKNSHCQRPGRRCIRAVGGLPN